MKPGTPLREYQERGDNMKKLRRKCIDCGSDAVNTIVDNMPNFRMEVVRYACGAEMKSSFSKKSNMGKAVHSGCTMG